MESLSFKLMVMLHGYQTEEIINSLTFVLATVLKNSIKKDADKGRELIYMETIADINAAMTQYWETAPELKMDKD
jgi:hypothetical protein